MTESGALGGSADARLDQIASIDDEDGSGALQLLEAVQSDYAADLPLIDETKEDGVNVADADPERGAELPLEPASDGVGPEDVMVEADLAQIDPVGADASIGIRTDEQAALPLDEEVQTASAVPEATNDLPLVGGEGAQELQPDQGSAIANQRDPANEVTLRARASSWVEIVRNDGEEVMTRLMREGDTYLIDASDSLYLSTGNAGGLEFVFNDGTVKEVGETGEIVRDLPLVISGLKAKL
jgi:cytoskeletal protein RodZ